MWGELDAVADDLHDVPTRGFDLTRAQVDERRAHLPHLGGELGALGVHHDEATSVLLPTGSKLECQKK